MKKTWLIPLAAVLILVSFTSCSLYGGGETTHTLYAGTGTTAPRDNGELRADNTTGGPVTQDPEHSSEKTDGASGDETTGDNVVPPDEPYDMITDKSAIASGAGTKTLRYPVFKGFSNEAVQKKINDYIPTALERTFEDRVPNVDELVSAGVSVQYEVTEARVTNIGGNILSLRFSVSVKYSNVTDETGYVDCMNFNLSTGAQIKEKKIYSNFTSVAKLFTDGKFKQISGESGLAQSYGLERMMAKYKELAAYGTYPATYFADGELVIVVSLEESEKYGDYAEFSISLESVREYLATYPSGA